MQENATFTADIIVSMDRANAKEKIKTLNYATQANINPNTHISGLAGPFGLGYGDSGIFGEIETTVIVTGASKHPSPGNSPRTSIPKNARHPPP